MLAYSFEFAFFKDAAKGYHIVNLLFHLANTYLVYLVFRKVTKNGWIIPVIVALLFGIHPMHVESVAWISELKDQLYSFFLLISLVLYLHYSADQKRKRYYFYCPLAFLASLLSKGQAVILPVLFILFDYLSEKGINRKSLLEKIPFFILSLLFGIIAILAQQQALNEAISQAGIRYYSDFMHLSCTLLNR